MAAGSLLAALVLPAAATGAAVGGTSGGTMAAGSLLAALVLPAAMSTDIVFAAASRCSAEGGGAVAADGPTAKLLLLLKTARRLCRRARWPDQATCHCRLHDIEITDVGLLGQMVGAIVPQRRGRRRRRSANASEHKIAGRARAASGACWLDADEVVLAHLLRLGLK